MGGGDPCVCTSPHPTGHWFLPWAYVRGGLGPLSRELFGRDPGRHVMPRRDDRTVSRAADSPAASRGRLAAASWVRWESWERSSSHTPAWPRCQVWVSTAERTAEAQKRVGLGQELGRVLIWAEWGAPAGSGPLPAGGTAQALAAGWAGGSAHSARSWPLLGSPSLGPARTWALGALPLLLPLSP